MDFWIEVLSDSWETPNLVDDSTRLIIKRSEEVWSIFCASPEVVLCRYLAVESEECLTDLATV